MEQIISVFQNLFTSVEDSQLYTTVIVTVLLAVLILSAYEFVVYRFVSHRAFYNKSFNICIAVIPFFISMIILTLQSNLVITLGTIGALAIIRFRTAVKDPIDMLYILWAVFIGITCGCQLYEVAVITSVLVTIILIVFENVNLGGSIPIVLVFHCYEQDENQILDTIKSSTKKYKIKSRNYTSKGMDYVIELSTKKPAELTEKLRNTPIEKFSIIEYDCDDIV